MTKSHWPNEWIRLAEVERNLLEAMFREGATSQRRAKKCVGVLLRALDLGGKGNEKTRHALTDDSAEWTENAEELYVALIGLGNEQNAERRLAVCRGNLGSPNGDEPAHPNFTECYLTAYGARLIRAMTRG